MIPAVPPTTWCPLLGLKAAVYFLFFLSTIQILVLSNVLISNIHVARFNLLSREEYSDEYHV
jgi:hypothetical protein